MEGHDSVPMGLGGEKRCVEGREGGRISLTVCFVLSADVLDKLFTLLYENDVVGEEVFLKWEERGREDLEGRGVALLSVYSFMTWLKSADSEDIQ